mmetsp:Transcript_16373/g.24682  ORF Transcript_16373/g.24682 Transcript_16373/m.24682 type:complete len:205 (+) Transcript_16373:1466-2080(+)
MIAISMCPYLRKDRIISPTLQSKGRSRTNTVRPSCTSSSAETLQSSSFPSVSASSHLSLSISLASFRGTLLSSSSVSLSVSSSFSPPASSASHLSFSHNVILFSSSSRLSLFSPAPCTSCACLFSHISTANSLLHIRMPAHPPFTARLASDSQRNVAKPNPLGLSLTAPSSPRRPFTGISTRGMDTSTRGPILRRRELTFSSTA